MVALTLVPAMGSTMLRKTKEKKHRWFEGFTNGYEKVLRFSLKHKIVVIAGVLALLVFAVFEAVNMGTAFMPVSYTHLPASTLATITGIMSGEIRIMVGEPTPSSNLAFT